jgi:hypothetical protein
MKGLGSAARSGGLRAALGLTLAGMSGCFGPSDDHEANSCSDLFGFYPAPGGASIHPSSALVYLDGITQTARLGACFYRDLARPADRAAVTWISLDPSIATVDPARGPTTVVKGHRAGRTVVVAVITGLRREAAVTVCNTVRDCPPPP